MFSMQYGVMTGNIKIRGITLLELMLVLVIIGFLLVLAVRQYQQYKLEQQFSEVKYNVDALFQSLKMYYQANCQKGTLSPESTSPPDLTKPYLIQIANGDLSGYLPTNWQPSSPLLDTGYGYTAQFNPIESGSRDVHSCFYYGGSGDPACTELKTIPSNKILLWQVQIAVKVLDPTKTLAYKAYLTADCATDTDPSGKIVDCSVPSSEEPGFLVWQRLPSFASPGMASPLWLSSPVSKEFNMQYTHDPMYEMYNPNATSYQYYLCGG